MTRASISWNFPVVFATRIAKFLRVSLSKRITHKRYPAYILFTIDHHRHVCTKTPTPHRLPISPRNSTPTPTPPPLPSLPCFPVLRPRSTSRRRGWQWAAVSIAWRSWWWWRRIQRHAFPRRDDATRPSREGGVSEPIQRGPHQARSRRQAGSYDREGRGDTEDDPDTVETDEE